MAMKSCYTTRWDTIQASWDVEFDIYFAADLTPQACEALLGR
ncbi:UNVERIFIED_ORG: hypothetical protein BCL66_1441 [Martelella mediterranea]